MVKQDYLMRMINDLITGMAKMLFHTDIREDEELDFQSDTLGEQFKALLDLADEGKLEEALEEMDRILDQGHMESLKMALYFFEYLNRMDEDALEAKGLEREDLQEKILEAADRFGYRSMAEMLL
ncbi:MAG TPA: hypothetical protein IAA08_07380 [Candidatus Eubacterium avistercoris]|uniref:Uncharacterized protein n=1 Tax=Candidatus Eubacterium avistercoris TaxID=2838567 RepID=A0A9D2D3A9_9FIRM|nr:hypothetical protein [Candidatus Eubacterium avistercoris]